MMQGHDEQGADSALENTRKSWSDPRPDDGSETPTRARRWLRAVAFGFGALILLAVLAVLVALGTPWGRSALCDLAEAQVNQAIPGTLHIGRCASLSPWHLRLETLTLFGTDMGVDGSGTGEWSQSKTQPQAQEEQSAAALTLTAPAPGTTPLASIAALDLRLRLLPLLRRRVHITALTVTQPRVSLANDEAGHLALLKAVTKPAADTPVTEAPSADSPWGVVVDDLALRSASVVAPEHQIALEVEQLGLNLRWLPQGSRTAALADLRVELGALTARLLALGSTSGDAVDAVDASSAQGPAASNALSDDETSADPTRALATPEAALELVRITRGEARVAFDALEQSHMSLALRNGKSTVALESTARLSVLDDTLGIQHATLTLTGELAPYGPDTLLGHLERAGIWPKPLPLAVPLALSLRATVAEAGIEGEAAVRSEAGDIVLTLAQRDASLEVELLLGTTGKHAPYGKLDLAQFIGGTSSAAGGRLAARFTPQQPIFPSGQLDINAFREGALSLHADGLRYGIYTLPSLRLQGALEAEAAVISSLTLPYLRPAAPVQAHRKRVPAATASRPSDTRPKRQADLASAADANDAVTKADDKAQTQAVMLQGRVGFDGTLDIALTLNLPDLRRDPNWRALAPEVRGGVTGHIQLQRTAAGLLNGKGAFALRSVHWGDLRGGLLDVQGDVAGRLPHLTGALRFRGRDLRAGTLRFGGVHADVRASSGARWTYAAKLGGALTGPGKGQATFDLVADASLAPPAAMPPPPAFDAILSSTLNIATPNGTRYTLVLGRAALKSTAQRRLPVPAATSQNAKKPGNHAQQYLSLSDLKLESDALRAEANVNLAWPVPKVPGGRLALEVELRSAAALRRDMRALSLLLGTAFDLPEVTGKGRLEVMLEGSLRRPLGRIALDINALRLADAPTLDLESVVELERRRLAAQVEARLEYGGHLQLKGSVERDTPRLTWESLRDGHFDFYLTVRAFDLTVLRPWRPAEEAIAGSVELDLAFGGTLPEPQLQAELVLAGFHFKGRPPLSLNLGAEVDASESRFDLAVSDSSGPWAEGSAATAFPLTYALLEPMPDLLTQRAWRLALTTEPRGLGTITGRTDASEGAGTLPLSLALKLGLRHTPRSETEAASIRGEARVESAWQGSARAALAKLSERPDTCGSQAQPRAVVDVSLTEARTQLTLRGTLGDRELVRARAESAWPLLTWMRRGSLPETLDAWPTIAALVTLDESELSTFPVLCERAQGRISGTIELTDVLSAHGRATADLRGQDLRVAGTRAANARLLGAIDSEGSSVALTVTRRAHTLFKLEAGAPLWLRGAEVGLGAGALRGVLHVDDVPLPLLLSAAPNVREASGSVKGRLVFEGESLETLSAKGVLGFEDLSFALERPFMRIENVSGALRFAGDHIRIQQLRAQDYLGNLVLDGRVGLAGYKPADIELELRAQDYPLRTEGIVKAYLTGKIAIQGDLGSTELRTLDVTTYGLQVALPEERTRNVRSLEPHPNIIFAGNPGADTELAAARALALHREAGRISKNVIEAAIPMHVKVRTDTPFWLRRPEFALRLTLALDVHSRGPETRISGTVGVRRGFIQLMGRNFLFEEGEMRFSGGAEIDPNLDLTASYRLPSAAVVKLHVGGYLSEPILTFSSTDPALVTETDIIAAVLGFRSGPEQQTEAQAATRAALSGLVADLVGTVARREFGQFVPILMLESDGTLATSRVRAGLQADALIPKGWEDLVRGIYVEGVLGGDQRNEGVNAGFIIELFWPHSLSTRAGFRQPDNWSLDMLWEP